MSRVKDESQVLQVKTDRQRLLEYLEKHPTMSNEGLYFEFPKMNINTIRVYKSEFNRKKKFERVKPAICLILDVLRYKITLNSKLNKEERMAMDFLEEWSGYEEYKMTTIMKAAERLRKT